MAPDGIVYPVIMPADFDIVKEDPSRFDVAARMLRDGRIIGFGRFELQLRGSELVISVLTEDPDVSREEAERRRAEATELLVNMFESVPQMQTFESVPRRFELVLIWGKGSTWLGHWAGKDFLPGRPAQ